jgi:hypothetical protein
MVMMEEFFNNIISDQTAYKVLVLGMSVGLGM